MSELLEKLIEERETIRVSERALTRKIQDAKAQEVKDRGSIGFKKKWSDAIKREKHLQHEVRAYKLKLYRALRILNFSRSRIDIIFNRSGIVQQFEDRGSYMNLRPHNEFYNKLEEDRVWLIGYPLHDINTEKKK